MAARIPAVRRRRRQIVIVVEVAGGARHIRMAIGQQKPGRAVIELRTQPTVKGDVARFAGSSKLRADVVRIRSLLIVLQVAGDARRGQALELSDRGALVAILALHCRVSA